MKRGAGRYKHRVDLYRPTRTQDPQSGQWVIDWGEPVANVAAEIVANGGGTSVRLSQIDVTYSHTVFVRQSNITEDLNPTWRIGFKGRTFEIVSVEPDPETGKAEWEIQCTEKVVVGG